MHYLVFSQNFQEQKESFLKNPIKLKFKYNFNKYLLVKHENLKIYLKIYVVSINHY